jgi:hypothetical protein
LPPKNSIRSKFSRQEKFYTFPEDDPCQRKTLDREIGRGYNAPVAREIT